jgi:transcriptional regulator with XRE-family HTH domain
MKPFGETLQMLMKHQNLSARELARRLEVPQKTLSEWVISNRTPRDPLVLKKMSNLFNCSVHFLLFGEEDRKNTIEDLLEKTEIHAGLYEISIKRVRAR